MHPSRGRLKLLGGIATGRCWEPFSRNWDRLRPLFFPWLALPQIDSALKTYVGLEESAKMDVSCHIFLEEWAETSPAVELIPNSIQTCRLTENQVGSTAQSSRAALPPSWIALLNPSIGSSIARLFCRWRDTSVCARLSHGIVMVVREAKSEK